MMAGVTSVFDAAARDFIALAPLLWDRVGQIVVESAPPQDGARVLDACCGAGSAALPAAECAGPNGQVDCVDLSAPLIEALKSRLADSPYLGRVHAFTADITTWEAGPSGFPSSPTRLVAQLTWPGCSAPLGSWSSPTGAPPQTHSTCRESEPPWLGLCSVSEVRCHHRIWAVPVSAKT